MYGTPKLNNTYARLSRQQKGEHWIEALKDGRHVLIRPLQPADREREFQFIRHLSPEARRARFLGTLSEPGEKLMEQLMDVDHHEREAYVALEFVDGELREIGVARYSGVLAQARCECAVVVADAWQRCGLGNRLLIHLMDSARRNGFARMSSLDLSSNVGAERLFKGLGFSRHYAEDAFSEMVHEIEL